MIPDFISRKAGAPAPPGIAKGPNRSRRGSAYLRIPGLTDKQGGHTFSSIYPGEGRPALQVTSCDLTINGKDYGLIVEAAISFVCNTLDQFRSVQDFLKPKKEITISFGYTDYNPWGSGGSATYKVTSYKYSFSLNASNQIECTVNGIGRASGFKSFQVNRTIASKSGQSITVAGGQPNVYDSILQAIQYPILDRFRVTFANGIEPLNEDTTSVPQTGPISDGVHLYYKPPKEAKSKNDKGSNTLEPLLMLELGTLLSWIQEILKAQDPAAEMDYSSLGTGRKISGICTTNPSKIFFADALTHGLWTQIDSVSAQNTIDGDNANGKIFIFKGAPAFTGNLLTEMLIGYDLLFEILTEVDTSKKKSESGIDRRKPGNITLEDFLAKIGSAVNDASGGVYDLRLVTDPKETNQNKFYLVDQADAGNIAPSPTVYRALTGDGVTRSVEMTGEPDQDMINGALYASGIKSGTTSAVDGKENAKIASDAAVAKENLVTLITNSIQPDGQGFTDDTVSKLKAEVVTILQGQKASDPEVRMQVPGPLNLGITVDGNDGFKFGQIITADVVQGLAGYDQVCFRVIEIKHSIKENDWETKVSTVMDII